EEDARVVAWIVIAEAGVGVVNDIHREIDRTIRAMKPVNAAADLWREIDGGGVGRRDVGGGEEDAARDMHVGDEALRPGEIPLHEKRLDARTIDRAVRREDGVDRHDLNRALEIPANGRAGEKIGRKQKAGPPTRVEELRVGGLAGAGAAAEKRAQLPG